jgi:uncharacterized protein YbcI
MKVVEMNTPRSDIADKVAKAAMALHMRELGVAPSLVVVVASADALMVTMCGSLTPQDHNLAHCSKHNSESQQFQQQHFAQFVEPLRREIERITESPVLESSVDVEESTGSVVLAFSTANVLSVCLLAEHTHADDWTDSEIAHQP